MAEDWASRSLSWRVLFELNLPEECLKQQNLTTKFHNKSVFNYLKSDEDQLLLDVLEIIQFSKNIYP